MEGVEGDAAWAWANTDVQHRDIHKLTGEVMKLASVGFPHKFMFMDLVELRKGYVDKPELLGEEIKNSLGLYEPLKKLAAHVAKLQNMHAMQNSLG